MDGFAIFTCVPHDINDATFVIRESLKFMSTARWFIIFGKNAGSAADGMFVIGVLGRSDCRRNVILDKRTTNNVHINQEC